MFYAFRFKFYIYTMQYKVPQNIDMEDRIVGPLTLIQFVYVIIGGMIDYILFSKMGPTPLFFILAIPISLIALAFAFLKVQDQPFLHFVSAAVQFITRPKTRVWKHSGEAGQNLVIQKGPATVSSKISAKIASRGKLDEVAGMLDRK